MFITLFPLFWLRILTFTMRSAAGIHTVLPTGLFLDEVQWWELLLSPGFYITAICGRKYEIFAIEFLRRGVPWLCFIKFFIVRYISGGYGEILTGELQVRLQFTSLSLNPFLYSWVCTDPDTLKRFAVSIVLDTASRTSEDECNWQLAPNDLFSWNNKTMKYNSHNGILHNGC